VTIIMANNQKNVTQAGRPVLQRQNANMKTTAGEGKSRSARKRRNRRSGGVIQTSVPVSIGTRSVNPVARIGGAGNVVRVAHREYVADVNGSVAYSVVGYAVNPGQAGTFPWLSILARNFEKYRFRKCHFIFQSSVSTTVGGVVLSAIDLDASDPAPPTKQTIMSYQGAARSNVWLEHKAAMPEMQPELYVRSGLLPGNTDVKTYDAGNFWLATQGEIDDSAIGELYVEYDVELHVPQLQNLSGGLVAAFSNAAGAFSFLTAVKTGTAPYVAITAGRIGFVASPGSYVMVQTAQATTVMPVSSPAVGGSTSTLMGSEICTASGAGNYVANYVYRVNSVTNAAFGGGAGLFIIDVTAGTGTSIVAVSPWEEGVPLP
jgi:hypothetical protein